MGKRRNGKGVLVDTLFYRFEGIELNDGRLKPEDEGEEIGSQDGVISVKTVPVQVRLLKEFKHSEKGDKRPVEKVEFTLCCENPKFQIFGSDIEALRKAAWDFLDDELRVKWEPYFLVRIEPGFTFGERGRGVNFIYKSVDRGVAHDGTLLLREFRNRDFVISPWPGEFRDKRKKLMACIPATESNEEALEQFEKMIDQMRERLADFFRPDQIMKTLENLGAIKMLGNDNDNA